MSGLAAKVTGVLAAGVAGTVGIAAVGLQAIAAPTLTPTEVATSQIPPGYLALYQSAAEVCALPWPILAAVGQVESDQGRDTSTSATGAVGPMQFEPATWTRWGVDGDGDGHKDPRDPADAIPAAADYLCALGVTRNPHDALVAYNCGNTAPACQTASAGYAATVLAIAASYATTTATSPVATEAVQVALAQLGTPYLWGGESSAGFDCSGLVQYAYAKAGLALPRTAQDQYDATTHLPAGSELAPGDLVFFGANDRAVDHVGIALGDGRMIDAPHTGADVRLDTIPATVGAAYGTLTYLGATRPTAEPS
ncbi:MAG TPA: bifunctional lytic transglycosylase/C40 family peptidase [Mycobacteriales bacterium]|nr:bifunctional lytic transglycosylase/C40 family peptidase [Mycobacteriales bacterium]